MVLDDLLEKEHREGHEEGLAEGRNLGLAEGRNLGLAEGRNLGLAEGRNLGLAEGREEERSFIIVNCLKHTQDVTLASDILGLPVELIRKVADENEILLR